MTHLYVFAQQPPTPDGTICPVNADSIDQAVAEAEKVLGVTLRLLGGGRYADNTREFFLYFGETGQEYFAQHFAHAFLLPAAPFKFNLGQVVATPGALRAIEAAEEVSSTFLIRHQTGDWGVVGERDKRANDEALKNGSRIFSAHRLKDGTKIWIITETVGDDGNRASTCVLLPDEY